MQLLTCTMLLLLPLLQAGPGTQPGPPHTHVFNTYSDPPKPPTLPQPLAPTRNVPGLPVQLLQVRHILILGCGQALRPQLRHVLDEHAKLRAPVSNVVEPHHLCPTEL